MSRGSTSGSTGANDSSRGNAENRGNAAAGNDEIPRAPRVLFLTDSLAAGTPHADALIWLAASLNAGGAEAAIVSFLPCKKARREQIRALGVPVRYLQFFNSRIKFYAPGLTGTVLFFRPDAVVLASTAAHLHAGPLARAFRGLRLVSLSGNAGLLRRLARRRCADVFDEAFPPKNASPTEREAFLKRAAKTFFGK